MVEKLLSDYDAQLVERKGKVLHHLQQKDRTEEESFQSSMLAKDELHSGLVEELGVHDELIETTFNTLLAARDQQNRQLSQQIDLIQAQLLVLSRCELLRRDELSDRMYHELMEQRIKLATLLASLLSTKRKREKQVKSVMENQLAQRCLDGGFGQSSPARSTDNFTWLHQVQLWLDREPFEVQLDHYGLDYRLADMLLRFHHSLQPDGQRSLTHYMPHFVDMKYEDFIRLRSRDLLALGLNNIELVDALDSFLRDSLASGPLQGTAPPLEPDVPSAPPKSFPQLARPSGARVLFDAESECVICLSRKVSSCRKANVQTNKTRQKS